MKREWSRRDLFKGVLATGVVAGGLSWSSPWRIRAPEPVFERPAQFALPFAKREKWEWRWLVLPPTGPAIELDRGKASSEEEITLAFSYPFRGESLHGDYRYWLEFNHPVQGCHESAPVVIPLQPYRFGC